MSSATCSDCSFVSGADLSFLLWGEVCKVIGFRPLQRRKTHLRKKSKISEHPNAGCQPQGLRYRGTWNWRAHSSGSLTRDDSAPTADDKTRSAHIMVPTN